MAVLGRSYVLPIIIRPRLASGSSSTPVSLADSVPISDVLTEGPATRPRSLADSVPVSDAVTRTDSLPRSLADSVPISDAVTGRAGLPRSLSDSVPVSDSLVRSAQALTRAVADTVPISDALSGAPVLTRFPHIIVMSGAVERDLLLASQPNVNIVIITPVDTASVPTSLADSVPISDSLTRGSQALSRSLADSVPLSDTVSRSDTLPRAVSDTVPISDAITGRAALPRALADSVPVSDTVAGVPVTYVRQRIFINRADTTGYGQGFVRLYRSLVVPASVLGALSDSVPISDAVSRGLQTPRSLADSVPISDAVVTGSGQSRSLADSIPIGDTLTVVGGVRPRSLSDSVPLSDTVSRSDGLPRSLTDSIPVSDALFRGPAALPRPLTDSVPISDTVVTSAGNSRTLLDTVSVGDSLIRGAVTRLRTPTDTVVVSDALSRTAGTRPRTVSDSVPLSDTILSQFDLVRIYSIRPLLVSTWVLRPLPDAWMVRPIGGHMTRSVLSLDYLRYAVQASASPIGDAVQFAFVGVRATPAPTDWVNGSWESSALPTGEWVARCLVGPGGAFVPQRNTYSVWVKITDNPTVPVWNVGTRAFA